MTTAFHDHFSGVAANYASFRPHYPPALFDYLATLVPTESLVWDCAAGSGQATGGLASRFTRVVATDASKEQVASAAAIPNVEWRVATAEDSGLADGTVGLITVAQALHWFDLDRFYAEAKRVLKPDGVLAVWAYGVTIVEGEAVNTLVQDYYSNVVGPYWPPERKVVEEGYRTVPFPFKELTPPSIDMETRWTMDQLLGYLSTWSATSHYIKARGQSPLEELGAKLADVWGDPRSPRRVSWPLTLKVGRRT